MDARCRGSCCEQQPDTWENHGDSLGNDARCVCVSCSSRSPALDLSQQDTQRRKGHGVAGPLSVNSLCRCALRASVCLVRRRSTRRLRSAGISRWSRSPALDLSQQDTRWRRGHGAGEFGFSVALYGHENVNVSSESGLGSYRTRAASRRSGFEIRGRARPGRWRARSPLATAPGHSQPGPTPSLSRRSHRCR